MQVVHRLHRKEDEKVDFRRLFGISEAQIESTAALDDLFEELVDRVLVAVREAGDEGARFFADAADEPRSRDVLGVFRRVGEEVPEIALVEIRVVHAVVLALLAVVLAERLADARPRSSLT